MRRRATPKRCARCVTPLQRDAADLSGVRANCIEYMLDPVAACPGPSTVALAHANLVAAYLTLVAASVPYPAVNGPTWRVQSPATAHRQPHVEAGLARGRHALTHHAVANRIRAGHARPQCHLTEAWLRMDTPPPAYVRTVLYQPVRSLRGPHAEANAGSGVAL